MTTLSLGFLAALLAQAPAVPPAAPRYERPVAVAAPGPQRLAIDLTLLSGSAPFTVVRRGRAQQRLAAEGGLSDLRLTTTDGREVPYLLVSPPVAEADWIRGRVQPVAATKKTSGFEVDLGSVQSVNGLDVRGLPDAFMKRFSLEASGDRAHWTMVIGDGTLFALPDQQLRQTQASFAAGPYRYLRVTWDDTESARVPPPSAAYARVAADAPAPEPLIVPLQFERRPSEPGRSRYHVTLPAARLPIVALRLEVGGNHVFRRASVTEPRLSAWQAAPVTIGQALLVRDERDGATMPLRLAVQQPSEAELDLLVEDGDNPPLDLRGISAEFAELPWIYFEAPGPVVARYGDLSLPRPSYDLEAARASLHIDAVPEARWASRVPNPLAGPAPPTDPATLTGGPLDVSSFHYSRAIAPGQGGLVALPLDAAVLAHSQGPFSQFADVRIVDPSNRQIPRLVERRPEPLIIGLRAEPAAPRAPELGPQPGHDRTVYRIALPYAALPDAALAIATTARVFRRHVEIGFERAADRRHRDPWFTAVRSVDWSHTDTSASGRVEPAIAPAGSADTSTLTLPLANLPADATDLTLVIDEGDNSALPISKVQLLLPSYRLRFVRPTAATRLVYGSPKMDAPRYDLALLAPRVLGAPVADVGMSPEAGTPTAAAEQLISPRVFWGVLIAAAIALLAVLALLLRKPT